MNLCRNLVTGLFTFIIFHLIACTPLLTVTGFLNFGIVSNPAAIEVVVNLIATFHSLLKYLLPLLILDTLHHLIVRIIVKRRHRVYGGLIEVLAGISVQLINTLPISRNCEYCTQCQLHFTDTHD